MPTKINYARPIPEGKPMGGWKDNVVDAKNPAFNELLVPLGPFSKYPEIASDGVYYGERKTSPYDAGELDGALLTSFVRKGVAERLVKASKHLPERCVFMTLDTLRTEKVQSSLFENFKKKLVEPPFNMPEEEAIEKTQQYVSQPSRPNSPHMTSGAVDVTIVEFKDNASWKQYQALTRKLKDIEIDGGNLEKIQEIETRRSSLLREKGKMLNMGVAFDQVALDEKGRDKTALRYYEEKLATEHPFSEEDVEPLKNRRLLYNVLTSAGFTLYPDEPWHADFGNKFWAQQSGKKAFYGFAEPSAENMKHEDTRREFLQESIFLHEEYRTGYAEEVGKAMGRDDPSHSNQPKMRAHRISPAGSSPS
jgi:D-alanyl-D-alanine dipeptidase